MELGQEIEEITVALADYILTVSMNRPAKKNALIPAMYLRMAQLIKAAGESRDVRVILVKGTRECFSSGNDVASFGGATDGASTDDDVAAVKFLKAIAACELPIVAAVNGHAVGVGTTMLLHCDFVIAGENARFKTPFVNLGVCPEAGSSYTMPMRMGYSRAAEMLLLGDTLSAEEAVACGLANSAHPVDKFE
ncbi:MAG: enoyl-CoA hydratase, partial [Halioglobus sp.]|nr:enoyl-CoA hydratase [Halioglobus sp.]